MPRRASALVAELGAAFLCADLGITPEPREDHAEAIAEFAFNVNKKQQNIGARRLNSIVEKVCEDLSFSASERRGEKHVITGRTVKERLTKITAEEDRSKYLL